MSKSIYATANMTLPSGEIKAAAIGWNEKTLEDEREVDYLKQALRDFAKENNAQIIEESITVEETDSDVVQSTSRSLTSHEK